MANAITNITSQFSEPYLTLQEFKDAPTTIDYNNLVVGGNQAAQDAELLNVITRASSWIDQYCKQIIGATTDTEQQRSRLGTDGLLRFHPKYSPVVALTSLDYGTNFLSLVAAPDCSVAWIEEQEIIFPASQTANNWTSQGPLAFGFPSSPRSQVYLRYSYVNGYANTVIVSGTATQASMVVKDPTGIVPNQMLQIYNGINSETVITSSTYVLGSTTVALRSPLLYTHIAGVSVSALPSAIKQAAILVTTAFLKVRGDSSMTMTVGQGVSEAIGENQNIGTDLNLAKELLKEFRRIR